MEESFPTSERIQPLEIAQPDLDDGDSSSSSTTLEHDESPFADEVGQSSEFRVDTSATSCLPDARRLLYLSRFCYHTSELTWNFGSALWLAALGGNTSLFWVSAYYLAGRILIIAVVPVLSAKIDKSSSRSRLITGWVIGQHGFVMIVILLIYVALTVQQSIRDTDIDDQSEQRMLRISRMALVLICFCGAMAEVLHNALDVAIQRDWIVIMAEGSEDSVLWLQETNVVLRQLLLGCEIVVPFFTGSLLSLKGHASLWIVFALKGLSMIVVAHSMHKLCQLVPELQQQSPKLDSVVTELSHTSKSDSQDETIGRPTSDQNSSCCFYSDFRLYLGQTSVLGAGIALAFLYANILSFGGIMVAYLAETTSQSIALLGLWKGLSNISAVLGTIIFSRSTSSLETKGKWGLIAEASFLSVSVMGIFLNLSSRQSDNIMPLGSILLISGTILSRMGLWMYDLSVTQLYQTKVPQNIRGTVGGTQTLLNNAFEFVPFVLTMIVDEFWIVMVVGYSFVCMALVSYSVGMYGSRYRYGRVEEGADVIA